MYLQLFECPMSTLMTFTFPLFQNVKKDYKKYAHMFEQKDRTIRTKASKVWPCILEELL